MGEISEWVAAADLVLGKAGGLSSSEALTRLDQMRGNIARQPRPDAAARIASIVLGDPR